MLLDRNIILHVPTLLDKKLLTPPHHHPQHQLTETEMKNMAETWIEIKDIQKLFDAIVDEELDIIEREKS